MTARMIDHVEGQGKLGKITGSNIAFYTIKHCKSVRRANGTSSVDIMVGLTHLNSAFRMYSFSEVVATDESDCEMFDLQDAISNDHENRPPSPLGKWIGTGS